MSSVMSCGWQPSALQPTNQAASQISLKIPERLLAKGGGCIHQAVLAIALKVLFPLCLKLLCFFSSLRGSWGFWCSERGRRYYSIGACLFRGGGGGSFTVILAFRSVVVSAMSLPISFGNRARGMTMGARVHVTPISLLEHLRYVTDLVRVKLVWPGRDSCHRISQMGTNLKKLVTWHPLIRKLPT